MTADYPDYQTHQANATAIYNTRVPLARGVTQLGTATNQALAGGASVTLVNAGALDQPSWEVVLLLSLPAAVGTVPFAQLNVDWSMPAPMQPSWRDEGIGVAGNGAGNAIVVQGMGPSRAESVTMALVNLDPAQTLTYTFTAAGVSHVYERLYWRQSFIPSVNPNGFTFPFGDPPSGVLCSANPTIGPGVTQSRLLPAYLGRARLQVDNSGGANSLTVTITDPAGTILGSVEYYANTIAAVASPLREEIWLPARPVLLGLKNNGGAGNITPQVTIVSSEY